MPLTMSSRREIGKTSRRKAIVDAARSLLGEAGSDASAERIAQRAGVSTPTLYNLVGPREQLLAALMNDLFERLAALMEASDAADPIAFGETVVRTSVQLFCEDAILWRRVVHEMSSAYATTVNAHVRTQPIALQKRAMREAKAAGMLRRTADTDMTAHQIFASYNGALFMWAGGFLTDGEFLELALHGYWVTIAAFGSRAGRTRALEATGLT